MHLYLLRHGIAEPVAPGRDDASRTLTPQGIRRMKRQAAAFERAGFRVDRLFSSPLVRARQTADLLAPALGASVQETALLRPGCTLGDVAELLAPYPQAARVMLVGHQPYLARLVRDFTGGNAKMRTGMLAVVEAAQLRPGRGLLLGLYDPEVMACLAPAGSVSTE